MASQFTFEAIGTSWRIIIEDELQDATLSALIDAVRDRIDIFDRDYSRFRDDSLVSAISTVAGSYTLPSDAKELLALYRELYMITEGHFTPLIGSVVSDAGYDKSYSFTKKELVSPYKWDQVMEYAHPHLTVHKPVLLDFGAAGKGYLVDIVSNLLKESGIREFVVDAGGDIYTQSSEGVLLPVALEHPDDPGKAIGVAQISNESICGSAGNRRAWGEFHHIINPYTLRSPKHLKAVWVTAEKTLYADALATALFFVSPEVLKPRFTFEYLLMNADNTVEFSSGFRAEIFTA